MSTEAVNNQGTESPTVNVITDGLGLNARDARAFIILQNLGTAPAGISFSSTAPAAFSNCSMILYPATADGNGDGERITVNVSKQAMGVKFGAGTRNLIVTEYV